VAAGRLIPAFDFSFLLSECQLFKTCWQIRADAVWQRARAAKPKHFDNMTPAGKGCIQNETGLRVQADPGACRQGCGGEKDPLTQN
jgi:hypothetical protein